MDPAPRCPETHEFMPEDYFRRATPAEVFARDAPLEVDLGCGDGSFLLAMATHHPERNFLGVERLLGRVRKVCKRVEKAQLENVRLLRLESRYTIEWLLPEASVSRLHLLCPDPWPKARHHRRRLFQPDFLDAVRKVLAPSGEFLFMTDHPEYFEWAEDIMRTYAGLERLPWQEGDFFYPKTDFQQQWEAEGKSMHRMRLGKPA